MKRYRIYDEICRIQRDLDNIAINIRVVSASNARERMDSLGDRLKDLASQVEEVPRFPVSDDPEGIPL